ncbi:MAG: peptidoglycan DD-metalloendopeptidase family protein [Lachnospiraceae bacterium]|nr:peptidoglycan DD-metalloendopeptidase family protein [Lachnospiraceae bacterium]
MFKKKHKRKVSHIIIFTTDAVDARTRQLKIRPWASGLLTLITCVLLGSLIGYIVYEGQIWDMNRQKEVRQQEEIEVLEQEKRSLEEEIEELNVKLEVLSTTVNEQSQTADALQEELEQQSLPTAYPLSGSAGIEVVTEGEPMVIFTPSDGMVLASAKGRVTAIEEDENYGNKVIVDHGNGYVSVYFNRGDAQVKVGDEVSKGTTLFLIGENNKQLIYQIMQDDVYISPMDIMYTPG